MHKFHLDDPARLKTGTVYMSIMTDPDSVFRPWMFAHRNPMPTFVLFPRSERVIRKVKATHSEARWRWSNIVRAACGQVDEY